MLMYKWSILFESNALQMNYKILVTFNLEYVYTRVPLVS